jgi:putative transposase
VLWPERDGELTAFLRWLTHTHTQRWHAHYHSAGTGHLYQGRFRAFPIEADDHLAVASFTAGLAQRLGTTRP